MKRIKELFGLSSEPRTDLCNECQERAPPVGAGRCPVCMEGDCPMDS